ncbi:uncharacterized protein DS421_6g186100 [Arachis hypogaea]|nr:uncharacterized protein DS421_6g186100 [Arachis hypogaea]
MDASSQAKATMDVDNSTNLDTKCHLNDEAYEIPDVATFTQPSVNVSDLCQLHVMSYGKTISLSFLHALQIGNLLYCELTGSVRALSAVVRALTSKLECARIEHNMLKIISQQVQRENPLVGMTKKSRMEKDMSDVTQNLAERTTPKRNVHNNRSNFFDDFNTTIHMLLEITEDDDDGVIRGSTDDLAVTQWKPAKASYRKVNNKVR